MEKHFDLVSNCGAPRSLLIRRRKQRLCRRAPIILSLKFNGLKNGWQFVFKKIAHFPQMHSLSKSIPWPCHRFKPFSCERKNLLLKGTKDPRNWVLYFIHHLSSKQKLKQVLVKYQLGFVWPPLHPTLGGPICLMNQQSGRKIHRTTLTNPYKTFNKSMLQLWQIQVTTLREILLSILTNLSNNLKKNQCINFDKSQ